MVSPKPVCVVAIFGVFLCFLVLAFVKQDKPFILSGSPWPHDVRRPPRVRCNPVRNRKCVGVVARLDKSSPLIHHEKHANNRYETSNFRKINLNTYTDRGISTCSWARGEPLYLADENDDVEQMMITWVNEFNIIYTLNDGSLLGAYRDQGKIPDDYDLDLMIPVWLNFGCNDNNFINKTNQQRFCNVTNPDIKDNVIAVFDEQILLTSAPFYTVKMWYGFRLWRKKLNVYEQNFYADVVVATKNVGKNKALFRDVTCKCWFRSVPAQCIEPALDLLRDVYNQTKEQLLTPHIFKDQTLGARNAYEDRSLKNPFFQKRKKN